jgi:hypothetical protein
MSLFSGLCTAAHTGDGWHGVSKLDLVRALGFNGLAKGVVAETDEMESENGGDEVRVFQACRCVGADAKH